MNDLQKRLKDMVVVFVSTDTALEEQLIDKCLDEMKGLPTFSALSSDEIEEIRASIKSDFSIKLDRGFLIEEKGHEKWFLAKKASLEMKYWDRYKKYLLTDKGFSSSVVNTMDDVLDTLTDLLGDPTRDIAYKRRGLIIGDVQSGKTANYTGLICKGVDVGYKVVVLLTGTIEKLRQQTQKRIDEGFVGADSDAMMKMQENGQIIGVGKYDSSIRPMVLTSTTDDFKAKNATNLGFDLRNINGAVIFVTKKNSGILKRLNKWLKTFNQNGESAIDNSILVIDDESDNASINTKSDEEPTAINGQIRELLKTFTKSSYVGFTATPFANIFIDPDSKNEMVSEDLFPKDYIYSLNAPSNYTGARDIFNFNGKSRGMLVPINCDDADSQSIATILPIRHRASTLVRELPEDLETAIATFLLANTIEDLRGLAGTHRSMLVNISMFTLVQEQVAALINDYLKNMQTACKLYCRMNVATATRDPYIAKLKEVYETIYRNIDIPWEQVQSQLHNSCASIIVRSINQRSGKDLNYDMYKEGLRLIAVGGMSLSRGLTLEGLVVSYFYRNSKMYDTLMQMGRWFGYRSGYHDLCRIWMSDESIEWYRHISEATDELRDEVKRYEDTGLTPLDFGLRVRSDITSLLVTARNKMRSTESRECVISLSGVYIETPEIFTDTTKTERNFTAIKSLICTLENSGYSPFVQKDKLGFRNIPMEFVIDLLGNLEISPKNEQFNAATISKFIQDYRGNELKKWDISFATGSSTSVNLGGGITYHHPIRKFSLENSGKIFKMSGSKRRLGTSGDAVYGLEDSQIKEIKERIQKENLAQKDYFINVPRNPLLTIYVVELGEGVTTSTSDSVQEANLHKGKNVVGFGMGIPSLSDSETKYARYVLNKVAIQQIFEGESGSDDEEAEGDD